MDTIKFLLIVLVTLCSYSVIISAKPSSRRFDKNKTIRESEAANLNNTTNLPIGSIDDLTKLEPQRLPKNANVTDEIGESTLKKRKKHKKYRSHKRRTHGRRRNNNKRRFPSNNSTQTLTDEKPTDAGIDVAQKQQTTSSKESHDLPQRKGRSGHRKLKRHHHNHQHRAHARNYRANPKEQLASVVSKENGQEE